MTIEEFGLVIIEKYKEKGIDYSDRSPESVAERYLEIYPQCRTIVSLFAEVYRDVLSEPTTVVRQHLIFPDELDADASKTMAEVQALKIRNIATADAAMQASSRGIPLDAWPEIAMAEVAHQHRIMEMRESTRLKLHELAMSRDIGLDGAQRVQLTAFYHLEDIAARIKSLYAERTKWQLFQPRNTAEASEQIDNLRLLASRIDMYESDFYGRGKQTLVPIGGQAELRQLNEDTNSAGSGDASAETNTNAVSTPRVGIGFRRDGDAS